MCALVCDHVHTRASMCEDQSLTSSVFLCRSPHCCLRLSLSLNLEHTYLLVWLASGAQELPHFSGLSEHAPLCVAFDEDVGDSAEVLMLVQQALYLLRQLPSSSL